MSQKTCKTWSGILFKSNNVTPSKPGEVPFFLCCMIFRSSGTEGAGHSKFSFGKNRWEKATIDCHRLEGTSAWRIQRASQTRTNSVSRSGCDPTNLVWHTMEPGRISETSAAHTASSEWWITSRGLPSHEITFPCKKVHGSVKTILPSSGSTDSTTALIGCSKMSTPGTAGGRMSENTRLGFWSLRNRAYWRELLLRLASKVRMAMDMDSNMAKASDAEGGRSGHTVGASAVLNSDRFHHTSKEGEKPFALKMAPQASTRCTAKWAASLVARRAYDWSLLTWRNHLEWRTEDPKNSGWKSPFRPSLAGENRPLRTFFGASLEARPHMFLFTGKGTFAQAEVSIAAHVAAYASVMSMSPGQATSSANWFGQGNWSGVGHTQSDGAHVILWKKLFSTEWSGQTSCTTSTPTRISCNSGEIYKKSRLVRPLQVDWTGCPHLSRATSWISRKPAWVKRSNAGRLFWETFQSPETNRGPELKLQMWEATWWSKCSLFLW